MRWIALAGTMLGCWLGIAGGSSAAELVRVTPEGFLGSDLSHLDAPPGDERIFLAERGRPDSNRAAIRILDDGRALPDPFLTIGNVDVAGERGVMGLAFPPHYAASGFFYVFWTANGPDALDPSGARGDIRIVEYRRSAADPDRADPGHERLVLKVPHSATNHNGGFMEFGPDGYLYLSIGDNADRARARERGNLYGKVLRIDPSDPPGAGSYTIPPDNPFTDTPGARGEIWTLGLRNPYRGSFTPDGRLTIADVGEGTWEEINVGDLKGLDMGWPVCEGFCSPPQPGLTDPFFAYNQSGSDGFGGGCAVIGGHVVQDPALAALAGRYIYTDFCAGVIHSLDLDRPGGDFRSTGLRVEGRPVAFGTDARGCSYLVQTGVPGGSALYRIVADGAGTVACPRPPEPPPSPDTSFSSFIPLRAPIARLIRVDARCSVDCRAVASGRIRVSRNRLRNRPIVFGLRPARRVLDAGVRGRLHLRLPARQARAVRWAVRRGSRAVARITVRLRADDGSGGSATRTVRLVLPRQR